MSGCWLAAIWHLAGDFMDASWKRLDCRILIDISPRFRSRLIHESSNRHLIYVLTYREEKLCFKNSRGVLCTVQFSRKCKLLHIPGF